MDLHREKNEGRGVLNERLLKKFSHIKSLSLIKVHSELIYIHKKEERKCIQEKFKSKVN